ncbi:MAG: hypothetical protein ACM31D_02015 [Bacteroidota bacterium]
MSVRRGMSCVMKLLGLLVGLGAALYALAAVTATADSSVQVLMLVIAGGSIVIALVGGAIYGLGRLLGGGNTPAPSALSPEQQQLRDFQDYLDGLGKDN